MSLTSVKIGIVQRQPENINFLATHRFRVLIQRTPSVQYFCQEANLSGLSMGNASQPTPFTDIPHPGDKINFEDFSMTFPVDEDMQNYKEIANWIVGLGFSKQYGQFKDLTDNWAGVRSDITLLVLDSNQKAKHTIIYRDAFPTALSGIQFNTKTSDTNIPLATANFKYVYYEFGEVNADTDTLTQADR